MGWKREKDASETTCTCKPSSASGGLDGRVKNEIVGSVRERPRNVTCPSQCVTRFDLAGGPGLETIEASGSDAAVREKRPYPAGGWIGMERKQRADRRRLSWREMVGQMEMKRRCGQVGNRQRERMEDG